MMNLLIRLKRYILRFHIIFRNISFRVGGQIVSKMLSLISVPIIARALGPEMYGQWNIILLLVQYAAIAINFGQIMYGVRKVAQGDDPSTTLSDVISGRVVLASLSILVSAIVVYFLYHTNHIMFLASLVSLLIIAAMAVNPEFYFFGVKKMLAPSVSQTGSFSLYVLMVILMVRTPDDLLVLSIAYTLYQLCMSAITLWWLPSQLHVRLWFSFRRTFSQLKQCYKLGITNLVDGLSPTIPRLLLATMCSSYELGIYSAAGRFSSVIMLVYVGVSQAVGPYLVKLRTFPTPKKRRYLLGMGLFALAVGLVIGGSMFLFGQFLVLLLFGKSFNESVTVFKLLSLLWVTQMPLSLMLNNVVLYLGFDSVLTRNRLITMLSCAVFSFVFIHFWGLIGTVLATSAPILLSNLMHIHFFYRKFYRKSLPAS